MGAQATWRRIGLAVVVFSAIASTSMEARAQTWLASGFVPRLYLGGEVGYNHILNGSMFFAEEGAEGVPADGERVHLTQSGFGWSVYLGLRFSPWVGLEVAWDALYHPSAEASTCNYAVIDGVRAALRIHIPTGYNLEPFARIDLGWFWYGDEFQADEDGLGYALGIGANYQISSFAEMELLVLYRAWYFKGISLASDGDVRCGGGYCPFGEEYVHSVNVSVGFHWNAWLFAW